MAESMDKNKEVLKVIDEAVRQIGGVRQNDAIVYDFYHKDVDEDCMRECREKGVELPVKDANYCEHFCNGESIERIIITPEHDDDGDYYRVQLILFDPSSPMNTYENYFEIFYDLIDVAIWLANKLGLEVEVVEGSQEQNH